jgi:hypothetical protein
MQTMKISPQTPEAPERDLARKLRQEVAEWKAVRAPLRTCTAAGVPVERRSRRRSAAERLSA